MTDQTTAAGPVIEIRWTETLPTEPGWYAVSDGERVVFGWVEDGYMNGFTPCEKLRWFAGPIVLEPPRPE